MWKRSKFSMWAVSTMRGLAVDIDRQANKGLASRRGSDVSVANGVLAGILIGKWEK